MQTRRWTNPTQPQTLQIAVFLLYIEAVFNGLAGGLFSPIGLVYIVGMAAAGFGIANEKKWGYWVGVVIATLGLSPIIFRIVDAGVGSLVNLNFIIAMLMPVALFALLVHPQSRDYQRIWFS